jgi:putative RNA 2'-phosphotransferase
METLTSYRLSEFLSLILRHRPETIQLTLDAYGYAKIDDIISNAKENGYVITEEELNKVVHKSDKKRFKITGDRIRAIQGHSLKILIEEESQKPPALLYHGTKVKLKDKITQQGLLALRKSLVQLYADYSAAYMNNIEPLVFEIDAEKMYNDGFEFYLYDGVWQTTVVPAKYLTIKELHEMEQLKKITITKQTYFTKLIDADYKLDPRFNVDPWFYVTNCFICNCKKTRYSLSKKGARCDERAFERPAKRHSLPGTIISFEQMQNDREIIAKSVFEVAMKIDTEWHIENDKQYQGIGLPFHCPACNDRDWMPSLIPVGNEYKCRKCNTGLFRIDKPTSITFVSSEWP